MSCGIYEIVNTVNGRRYIGSSHSMKTRRARHFWELRKGVHKNQILQRAWNKYSEAAFKFLPILTCQKSMLLFYEQQLLDKVKPEYNIATDAAAPTKGMKHTPETLARMSAVKQGKPQTDAAKEKLRAANLGKTYPPRSQESRDRSSAALQGHILSDDCKAKISKANTGKRRQFSDAHRKNISIAVAAHWARRKAGSQHVE